MKKRKAIMAAIAVTITGVIALSFAGCEWFSFTPKKNSQSVSSSLGYEGNAGAWLAAAVDSPRSNAWQLYQEAIANKAIDPDEVSFLDFLRALSDDSASLATSLRSTVAIVSAFGGNEGSYGSGVIYSLHEDVETDEMTAYVLTNYHVVYSGSSGGIGKAFYTYLYGDMYDTDNLASDSAIRASYVGGAMDEDIAILKMSIPDDRRDFVQSISGAVGVRNSDDVNVGEKIYAIGNPLGAGISVVSGVVAVDAEYVSTSRIDNEEEKKDMLVMRIDAPANHGNSGGGLFDVSGRLVGIVNAGREKMIGDQGVAIGGFGYAIPANRALSVAQSILDNLQTNDTGSAYKGALGSAKAISRRGAFDAKTQSVDIVETVQITNVDASSPFGQEIEGKTVQEIFVTDGEGTLVISQKIVRAHQIDTILYNLRKGFTVTLVFDDGYATAEYSENEHFLQIK